MFRRAPPAPSHLPGLSEGILRRTLPFTANDVPAYCEGLPGVCQEENDPSGHKEADLKSVHAAMHRGFDSHPFRLYLHRHM